MNPRIIASQQRTFLALLEALRPHFRTDRHLPTRIQEQLGRNRALGARDRRLYRELLYTTLRYLPWIDGALCWPAERGDGHAASAAPEQSEEVRRADALRALDEQPRIDRAPDIAVRLIAWLAADSPATQSFRETLRGNWPAPAENLHARASQLGKFLGETLLAETLLPEWFRAHCPEAFQSPHLDALLSRAPLWLRLQTADPAPVYAELTAHVWDYRPSPVLPGAIGLPPDADITRCECYKTGLVEVQDLGSQMVLASVSPSPGQRWLDACAGAGGKTLQLASLVGASGRIDATDIRPDALTELSQRAARAKLHHVRVIAFATPAVAYDGVLVDAPCSGSGTWRRQPHLKWQTTPAEIQRFAATQLKLLEQNHRHVRPGGLLVYATCSLSHRENRDVVAAFLARHPRFSAMPPAPSFGGAFDGLGLTLLPGTHNTDGFYVASLRRKP